MKNTKPPGWFYASHTSGNVMLPDLHPSAPARTSEIRAEMERLDRIHDWLRSSYVSPVQTSRSPPLHVHNNKNNSNNDARGGISGIKDANTSASAPLPRLKTKEKTVMESFDPNFNSKFPKLGSIMTVSAAADGNEDPEIVGTRVSVRARASNDWRKRKSGASVSSENTQVAGLRHRDSEFYPTKILPQESTALEYEKKKSKTFYGLDSSFSHTNTSHHPLKRQVGPIQRPHSPVGVDLFVRQRTRYGDTMMHAKSPSKAFTEQQGKTYMLHAKLKDMLLER